MSLTAGDYNQIAADFKHTIENKFPATTQEERDFAFLLAGRLAYNFHSRNPRFKINKFLEACGVPQLSNV